MKERKIEKEKEQKKEIVLGSVLKNKERLTVKLKMRKKTIKTMKIVKFQMAKLQLNMLMNMEKILPMQKN